MEDNYQNMDDFFRKQLNSFDEPEEDWEKPDSAVWTTAQEQMGTTTGWGAELLTPLNKVLGSLFIGTLLLSSIYILQLQEEKNKIENLLKKNTEQTINTTTSDVNNTERQTQKAIINHPEKTSKTADRNNTTKQQKSQVELEAVIHQQEQTILELQKDKAVLQNSLQESLELQQGYLSVLENWKAEKSAQKKALEETDLSQTEGNSANGQFLTKTTTQKQHTSTLGEFDLGTVSGLGSGSESEVVLGETEKMGNTSFPVREGKNSTGALATETTTFANSKRNEEMGSTHSGSNDIALASKKERAKLGLLEKLNGLPIPDLGNDEKVTVPDWLKAHSTAVRDIKLPKKQKPYYQWQVGYMHGQTDFHLPVVRKFKRAALVSRADIDRVVPVPTHGLSIGFMPTNNWQVQTGFHLANQSIERTQQLSVFYDKSNEFSTPSGERRTELELTSKTFYSETEEKLNITLPQDREVEEGELLAVELTEKFDLKYWQVPLGVNYIFGTERLRFMLNGGGQWNALSFDNHDVNLTVNTSQEEWKHNRKDDKRPPRQPRKRQFLSMYGGAGLNYQLTGRLQAQAMLSYQHALVARRLEGFNPVKNDPLDRVLKVGLQYQF